MYLYFLIAIIIVALFVAVLLLRWRRHALLHAQATREEQLQEVLELVQSMKEELAKSKNPEKQTLFRTSSEKLVMTYITSPRPNNKIVHSLSLSQENLILKSAALISQLVVSYLQKEETWNGNLKVSKNNFKMVIYHFYIDMDPESHSEYLNTPLPEIESFLSMRSTLEKKSKEIKAIPLKKNNEES